MEKMEQKQVKSVYEAPCVEVLRWENDVIMASTDVGEDYNPDWN